MSATYQEFLERLKEERLRANLSQEEIGKKIRISQSHYSKIELGTRRLSYYEIQCLCEVNIDLYYIFTNKKSIIKNESFWEQCTFAELVYYLNMICSMLTYLHQNKFLYLPEYIVERIKNIQYVLMPSEKSKSIFYKLRRALSYNQIKMAEVIDVDVKKLRAMESGKILPDSEIIWQLSELFYIPHALLLRDKDGLICEISYLLHFIDENKRKDILDCINLMHKTMS